MDDGLFVITRFALFFGLPVAFGLHQLILLRRIKYARLQHTG